MKKINFSLFLVFLCIPLISFASEDCSLYIPQLTHFQTEIKDLESHRDILISNIKALQVPDIYTGDYLTLGEIRANAFAQIPNSNEIYQYTLKEGVLINEISNKKQDFALLQMKYNSCISEMNRAIEAQTYIDNFFKNLQASGFILKDSDKIGILQLTLKNQSTIPEGWIAYQAQRKKEHNAIRYRKIKKDLKK